MCPRYKLVLASTLLLAPLALVLLQESGVAPPFPAEPIVPPVPAPLVPQAPDRDRVVPPAPPDRSGWVPYAASAGTLLVFDLDARWSASQVKSGAAAGF